MFSKVYKTNTVLSVTVLNVFKCCIYFLKKPMRKRIKYIL